MQAKQLTYREQKTFQARKVESEEIIEEMHRAGKSVVPVILERDPRSKSLRQLRNSKIVIDRSKMFAQFQEQVRMQCSEEFSVHEHDSIFIFANKNIITSLNFDMGQVYDKYKDSDGFLYVQYSQQNTFGCAQ